MAPDPCRGAELATAGAARAFATGANKGEKEWTRVGTFVAQTLACTVAALALLGDAVLGLLLQLPVLLLACIPGVESQSARSPGVRRKPVQPWGSSSRIRPAGSGPRSSICATMRKASGWRRQQAIMYDGSVP